MPTEAEEAFLNLFSSPAPSSKKRKTKAKHVGGGAQPSNIPPRGNNPYGTRGEFYGEDRGMTQQEENQVKARNGFQSYIDNSRFVRNVNQRIDPLGTITMSNEEKNFYNNQRALVLDYENKQRNCDAGDVNACNSVGRFVGDGANPITNPQASEALFGFSNAPGYTRENVNIQVEPDGQTAPVRQDEATVPEPVVPDKVVEPTEPRDVPFIDVPGQHHDSHEEKHSSHTGGDIPAKPAPGSDGSASVVREEVVDLNQHDISSAGRGETQNEVKRYLENLKATQNPFLDPYKKQCFTGDFYSDNVRIH